MPQIESTILIEAPLEAVWELAQDVEKFPEIMPDLDAVKIHEREITSASTTRVVSEWNGRIAKFNRRVNWTEEDIWNSEERTCHFWQLRGDFNEYQGDWKFSDENGATQAKLNITYRFEIPLVGALMQKVVQNLLQDNSDRMLQALKTESERRANQGAPGSRLRGRRPLDENQAEDEA